MTALGQRRLRTSQVASKSEPALARAAADVPLEDKSVFQLLCDLQADKWMLCVHDPKTRKHPKPSSVAASSSQVPAPHHTIPYKPGQSKFWWLKEGSESIDAEYLRALLSATQHRREVPHFRPSSHYIALMTGQAVPALPSKRKKGTSEGFAFLALDDDQARLSMLVDKPVRAKAQQKVARCRRKDNPHPEDVPAVDEETASKEPEPEPVLHNASPADVNGSVGVQDRTGDESRQRSESEGMLTHEEQLDPDVMVTVYLETGVGLHGGANPTLMGH